MNDYQVMPDLSDDEYAELKADIEQRGVMVPIEFDELGNVLDGHHRLKICKELGIKDYPKVIRAGMSESEKLTHARKLNIARRHLNTSQKRELIKAQLKETPEKSNRQIAEDLGVDHKTVSAQRNSLENVGEIPQCKRKTKNGRTYPAKRKPVSVFNPTKKEEKAMKNPEIVERMQEDGTSALVAKQKVLSEAKAERKSYELPAEMPDDVCNLFVADIRDGLKELEDESVDFIVTDPPYSREYLPLYSDLSRLAERVLKPGGSLIAMIGQSYLPEVVQRLSENMSYYWILPYLTQGGGSPLLYQKRVNTFWKPVLWYVKGEYKGDYIGDILKSPESDKRFHEWGQSFGGMADIIERFTNPGDLILDPFLGGGTTGAAAVSMGRKFIGTDIKPRNVDISLERIKEVYSSVSSTRENRVA